MANSFKMVSDCFERQFSRLTVDELKKLALYAPYSSQLSPSDITMYHTLIPIWISVVEVDHPLFLMSIKTTHVKGLL